MTRYNNENSRIFVDLHISLGSRTDSHENWFLEFIFILLLPDYSRSLKEKKSIKKKL